MTRTDIPCSLNRTFVISENMTFLATPFLYTPFDRIMISKILPMIFAIGLVGNLSFLFSLLRVKWMRTVTNYYLANLAIADISFLLVVVGEKILAYNTTDIAGHMAFGRAGCICINFLRRLVYFASLFLVTLVSLERFYAICKPVQHWMLNGKKQTLKLVAFCWILSCVFALILIPSSSLVSKNCVIWPDIPGYRHLPNLLMFCNAQNAKIWTPVSEGIVIVPFVIALITNTVLYAMIIFNLHVRASSQGAKSSQSVEIRNQVARMLIINGTVFFLCLAPYQLTSFTRMILSSMQRSYLLRQDKIELLVWMFRILVYLNSVINPIVYTATSPRYRHGFLQAFSCGNAEGRKTYTKGVVVTENNHSTKFNK